MSADPFAPGVVYDWDSDAGPDLAALDPDEPIPFTTVEADPEPNPEPGWEPSGALVPAPDVRHHLKDVATDMAVRLSAWYEQAVAEREARLRGAPPVTADVAPVVRDLQAAAEDFQAIAGLFSNLAGQALDLVTNEALAVGTDRLIVPDGDTEIVVAPVSKTTKWVEPEPIRDVVAARRAAAFAAALEESGVDGPLAETLAAAHLDGLKAGWDEVLFYANPSWRTTAFGGLRQDLMAAGNDAAAAAVERAYGSQSTPGESLSVKREPLKKGRRL